MDPGADPSWLRKNRDALLIGSALLLAGVLLTWFGVNDWRIGDSSVDPVSTPPSISTSFDGIGSEPDSTTTSGPTPSAAATTTQSPNTSDSTTTIAAPTTTTPTTTTAQPDGGLRISAPDCALAFVTPSSVPKESAKPSLSQGCPLYQGEIAAAGERDTFTLELQAGNTYAFSVYSCLGVIGVVGPSGAPVVAEQDVPCNNTLNKSFIASDGAGTYTFYTFYDDDRLGKYQLTFNDVT
jgi:hypothetical protein